MSNFEAIVKPVAIRISRTRIRLIPEFFEVGQTIPVTIEVTVSYKRIAVCPLFPEIGDAVSIRVCRIVLPL